MGCEDHSTAFNSKQGSWRRQSSQPSDQETVVLMIRPLASTSGCRTFFVTQME
jgi:hypothetical protein